MKTWEELDGKSIKEYLGPHMMAKYLELPSQGPEEFFESSFW